MPIQKRSNKVIPAEPLDEYLDHIMSNKLTIEAKPKKEMPEGSHIAEVYPMATAEQIRRMGPLAIDCNEVPDQRFTIVDRVTCMRTPYDSKNPQEIRYRNRVRNRATAITAMCIVCQGGRKAVTECIDTKCPLWAFRFGGDPFYGKRG